MTEFWRDGKEGISNTLIFLQSINKVLRVFYVQSKMYPRLKAVGFSIMAKILKSAELDGASHTIKNTAQSIFLSFCLYFFF